MSTDPVERLPVELPPLPVGANDGPRSAGAQPDSCACDSGLLLEHARTGSSSALGRLLDGCRDYLLLVANEEVPSDIRQKMAASDLVQETLAEACEGFDRFEGQDAGALQAWLRRILLNNVVDATRSFRDAAKRDVSRELPLQADGSQALLIPQLLVEQASPSGHAIASEEHRRLLAKLARLPERYREIIQLRNMEYQSFVAIGLRMQLSADSARKFWDRAIEHLAKELVTDESDH